MTTATAAAAAIEPNNLRSIVRRIGAKLGRVLAFAGAPYTVDGAYYM